MPWPWHFPSTATSTPDWTRFGTLRVFNDDTLTQGSGMAASSPPRDRGRDVLCGRRVRHADENGVGGVLKEGWVQAHVGRTRDVALGDQQPQGRAHAVHPDPWFNLPSAPGLEPAVEQKAVGKGNGRIGSCRSCQTRTRAPDDLVGSHVLSSFLEAGQTAAHPLPSTAGISAVLSGGPVRRTGRRSPPSSGEIEGEKEGRRPIGRGRGSFSFDVLLSRGSA